MPIDDQEIERMLRADPGPIEDAGFTERVLGALPPRRRDARPWILFAATAVGAAAVALLAGPDVWLGPAEAARWQQGAPVPVVPAVWLALVAWACVALARADV
jgi:hypothetical protein